jgi:ABC-type antimicrobial peptide transport system permease subunit
MFKNYFVVAWRNFWKNGTFSLINTVGLALGMACSLFIMLWVRDEKSVDAFHRNKDRLYSVYERQYYDGKVYAFYGTPGKFAEEVKKKFPEVELATNMSGGDIFAFSAGDKKLKFDGTNVNNDFFKMFTFPLLAGDVQNTLNSPVSMAISKKMAVAFFGSPQNALGKTLRYDNRKDLKVTAVYDDFPKSSSLKADYLINYDLFLEEEQWAADWSNNGPQAFILLRENANPALVEKKLTRFLDNYNKEQGPNFRIELGMQRYDEVYLHNSFKDGKITGGRIQYVNLFSAVAIFILLIACINFMNLTTARSVKRSKEIGVRKVVGALRGSLVKQFLGEAIMMSFFALAIALLTSMLLLPAFNDITGKQITFPVNDFPFWATVVLLTILTGLIAGSYPSVVLSSFQPIRVLKGQLKFGKSAGLFRKGLVVFQFAMSITLIIGTIVVSKQINYISTTNLGYNKENLIYVTLEGDLNTKYELFKQRAMEMPGIAALSRMTQNLTDMQNGTGGVQWEGKDPNVTVMFTQATVGYDFLKTTGIKLIGGRDFSKDFASDSASYLINEAAASYMNYKDPVGKPLTFWGQKGQIIGLMKNFHFTSLHLPIAPLVIRLSEHDTWGTLMVRTKPGQTKQALATLEKLCTEMNPQFPFTYNFADEQYKKLYVAEQTVGKLSRYFAVLAIFISCLGLLGLTIFTAEQRTKEFGIRKVLGANVGSLFTLLSKEFLMLVALSMLVAFPVAWWAMNKWLENFAYKEDIGITTFIVAAAAALLIALSTISVHALRAALMNPVKSLRTE